MRKVFLGISSSIRKTFVDIFSARSNTTGSLGTASDGSQWEAVSKTIEVQGGKAVANYIPQPNDDGSEYPIAVVNMPTQNNIITLEDTDVGSGVALWVQTSADWWMVSVDSAYNTIPGATTYTSAPASFTGQLSYSVATTYSSSPTGFTSSDEYSAGIATYSSLPAEYSSGVANYTSGPTTYTSSPNTFSSGPTFSSSTPFTSNRPFTRAQVFSVATPYTAAPVWFSQINAYTSASSWTIASTWNRWSPYTAGNTYTRSTFFRNSPNSWSVRYTRAFSVANFWNLNQTWTQGPTSYTAATSTFQGTVWTRGPTTYTAAPATYSAGTTTYTAGAPNYTSATFYTSAAGTFTSNLVFSSTVPYSSNTPYSSAIQFSSSTNYFADISFSTVTTFTSGTGYTSSIGYTSNTEPDSFAYAAILKISRSVSDTVSEISSLIVSTTQTIKSILVQTSGNQITAKAFSDITPITQLGDDLIYNATGVIINTKYGISISKAEYTNNEIGSSVKIERG
jgi:hypothetical protein